MIYVCNTCGYQTRIKSRYSNHCNRKIKCTKNHIHGSVMLINEFYKCDVCGREYLSVESFNKHLGSAHAIYDIPEDLVPFDHYDIDDLSLFEQYYILASDESMHISILNLFQCNKSIYRNMIYRDAHRSDIDVFDGNKWSRQTVNDVVEIILKQHNRIIVEILRKFTDVLKKKSFDSIQSKYFDANLNKKSRLTLIASMKKHIANNNDFDDIEMPDHDNVLWNILKPNMAWTHVVSLF